MIGYRVSTRKFNVAVNNTGREDCEVTRIYFHLPETCASNATDEEAPAQIGSMKESLGKKWIFPSLKLSPS
jgi:hypothetical protein